MSSCRNSGSPIIIACSPHLKFRHIGALAVLLAAILGSGARPDDALAATRITSAGAEFCRRFLMRFGRDGLPDSAAQTMSPHASSLASARTCAPLPCS